MKNYMIELLGQPSTWRGLILILTAVGLNISPDQSTAIVTAGLSTAGVLGAFFKD